MCIVGMNMCLLLLSSGSLCCRVMCDTSSLRIVRLRHRSRRGCCKVRYAAMQLQAVCLHALPGVVHAVWHTVRQELSMGPGCSQEDPCPAAGRAPESIVLGIFGAAYGNVMLAWCGVRAGRHQREGAGCLHSITCSKHKSMTATPQQRMLVAQNCCSRSC